MKNPQVPARPDRDGATIQSSHFSIQAVRFRIELAIWPGAATAPVAPATAIPAIPTPPRSSNLRVAKAFSQRDKDAFKLETFAFMARFFENSLDGWCQTKANRSRMSRIAPRSSRELTPFDQGVRTVFLEDFSTAQMAFVAEMIVDRRVG